MASRNERDDYEPRVATQVAGGQEFRMIAGANPPTDLLKALSQVSDMSGTGDRSSKKPTQRRR